MINIPNKSNQSKKTDSSDLNSILKIGIYLSSLAIILLLFLLFYNVPLEIQQVIVVVIGILLLGSFSTFNKIIQKPMMNPP